MGLVVGKMMMMIWRPSYPIRDSNVEREKVRDLVERRSDLSITHTQQRCIIENKLDHRRKEKER